MPAKNFEDRLERLEQIAAGLKDGKIPLEEAIALFEEGSKLAKALEKELSRVERKVQVLSADQPAEAEEPALGLFPELDEEEDARGR